MPFDHPAIVKGILEALEGSAPLLDMRLRLGILRPMRYRSGMVKFPRRLRRQGPLSAEAYASDASLYQILPESVVLPENARDAAATVRQALAAGKAVTPRGGGTGLAGGALGEGLIVDC